MDFKLELIREPIRESREDYINPFRAVKETQKELIKLKNSINIGGPKIRLSKKTWTSLLIFAIILITSSLLSLLFFY